jgi:hypothetical protein
LTGLSGSSGDQVGKLIIPVLMYNGIHPTYTLHHSPYRRPENIRRMIDSQEHSWSISWSVRNLGCWMVSSVLQYRMQDFAHSKIHLVLLDVYFGTSCQGLSVVKRWTCDAHIRVSPTQPAPIRESYSRNQCLQVSNSPFNDDKRTSIVR